MQRISHSSSKGVVPVFVVAVVAAVSLFGAGAAIVWVLSEKAQNLLDTFVFAILAVIAIASLAKIITWWKNVKTAIKWDPDGGNYSDE